MTTCRSWKFVRPIENVLLLELKQSIWFRVQATNAKSTIIWDIKKESKQHQKIVISFIQFFFTFIILFFFVIYYWFFFSLCDRFFSLFMVLQDKIMNKKNKYIYMNVLQIAFRFRKHLKNNIENEIHVERNMIDWQKESKNKKMNKCKY